MHLRNVLRRNILGALAVGENAGPEYTAPKALARCSPASKATSMSDADPKQTEESQVAGEATEAKPSEQDAAEKVAEKAAESAEAAAAASAAKVESGDLAPGVPRLGVPDYAAKRAPEVNRHAPSMLFLIVVSFVSFISDIGTKLWAEAQLKEPPFTKEIIANHLSFNLAKNRGGAWGLFGTTSETLRLPFFLVVSVLAIWFIMTLYNRLHPSQHALRWGLPLVFGGALGNVFDRVRYGYVIDFIDYKAAWVTKMNEIVAKVVKGHFVTDHWPTFNIADVAICIGVGLMAVDMFTSRRGVGEVQPETASA
jgi:signal peptidase II